MSFATLNKLNRKEEGKERGGGGEVKGKREKIGGEGGGERKWNGGGREENLYFLTLKQGVQCLRNIKKSCHLSKS